MPLTGRLLIALAFGSAAVVLAATVWGWSRARWLRYLVRPAGVLLTQALLLVSVGLLVNRQEGFYPSWEALFSTSNATAPNYRAVAGSLDAQLKARAGAHPGATQSLVWKPAGVDDWRLAAAPLVVVPAGYLEHPQWRYSVVMVVDGPGWPAAWPDAARLSVAASAKQDVVVYVTATSGTPVQALAAELPNDLRHDLRVTAHRWAIVTTEADGGLAQQAVLAAPGEFPAVATVQNGASSPGSVKSPGPKPTTGKPAGSKPVPPKTPAKPVPPKTPAKTAPLKGLPTKTLRTGLLTLGLSGAAGHTTSEVAGPASLPAGIATFTVRSPKTAAGDLSAFATAVGWAATQTPPPLAASAPPVKYLPVHKHPRTRVSPGTRISPRIGGGSPAPAPGSSQAATLPDGGTNGSGQPRN